MRHTIAALVLVSIPFVATPTVSAAQQEAQDDSLQTRGAFFATRPARAGESQQKSGASSAKPKSNTSAKAGKSSSQQTASSGRKNSSSSTPKGGTSAGLTKTGAGTLALGGTTAKASAASPDAVGVGYTLYMRDASGDAVRVDPRREFAAGEGIRIALETNTDGYLYVFHTEDGRNPQMLFPHTTLNRGANNIASHSLYQVPPALDKWFEFDERPATERLYVVVSRKPLEGAPAGAALVKHCEGAGEGEDCYWKPTPTLWSQIEKEAGGKQILLAKSEENVGQAQTTAEREALTRGIKLSKADPAPSVVYLNASPSAALLVATIELVHK